MKLGLSIYFALVPFLLAAPSAHAQTTRESSIIRYIEEKYLRISLLNTTAET